ncbi:IclR family transcriptional regulator [Lacisediminimonas profundi]|uniref:IclR family transcriptional regulator n=1 Tax=Lacisediminimonas profundi TaxID=2603856 RepID=UPI00124B66A7|nr:IclR family transcriptional regulator [Lacisediminimonas profundi]
MTRPSKKRLLAEGAPAPESTVAADKTSSSLYIQSVAKAFRVLHAFDGPQRNLSLVEIAKAAQLDRSATQRLVYTLESLGYLQRIPDTRLYGLTAALMQFSFDYVRSNSVIDRALPYLQELNHEYGETTNLQELLGSDIVLVARFLSRYLANLSVAVGSRLPAFCSASGTALLSRIDDATCEQILNAREMLPLTPYTETRPDRIRARIREARAKGYALIANECLLGDISVAAPVVNAEGIPVAAVNISVPEARWTIARVEQELAPQVVRAAKAISATPSRYY